tara:strand:+ start:110 stop:1096 length:987 start_codon:yes stop_codon:yes gene_type:complete
MINNSKILYIGPKFFGYEVEIQKTIKSLGGDVDFFDDRPKNTFLVKVLIRLKLKFFLTTIINNYYSNIFKKISKKKYDYVLIIAPETLDYKKLAKLKKIQPYSKFILYMWDSFSNKNSFNTIRLFDKIISFDSRDAKKYNLNFLPLFYIKDYEFVNEDVEDFKFDLCITATAHSDRYAIADKLRKQLSDYGLIMFSYFFLPSKIIYWARKIFLKKYAYGHIKNFSFSFLTQKEIIKIIEQSKVVLDINHPLQYGLTSRCLEALGANRKLITTNENIKEYDFYDESNIRVIDRKNPIIDREFFDSKYIKPKKEIYQKYSIKNWLINIFD